MTDGKFLESIVKHKDMLAARAMYETKKQVASDADKHATEAKRNADLAFIYYLNSVGEYE